MRREDLTCTPFSSLSRLEQRWCGFQQSTARWISIRRASVVSGRALGPVRLLDDEGGLLSTVREILDLAREAEAIVGTGHIAADEHYAVVKAYGRQTRIVVTHAGDHPAGPCLTPTQSRELAELSRRPLS